MDILRDALRRPCRCCTDVLRLNHWPYAPLLDFEEAARRGCPRCSIVLKGVLKSSEQWKDRPASEARVSIPGEFEGGNLREIWIRWPNEVEPEAWEPKERWRKVELQMYFSEGSEPLFPKMLPRRSVPVESDSGVCFDAIKAWISECSEKHVMCNLGHGEEFLPTRLIDASPDHAHHGVRLVHSFETIDTTTKYAALSHSWGEKEQRIKPIPKTRKGSIDSRLKYISFEELTKTFQDAVIVVRRLGLRYIWIDSLCIVQDDDEDFAVQAGQMAKIYGRAHLVISALRAATGDVGIFHHRYKAQQISHKVRRGNDMVAFVRPVLNHDDFITGEPRDFKTSPLFARAWCFQERLLASRIVHFADSELVWECNEQLSCECRGIITDSLVEMNNNFKRRQALALQNMKVESRLRTWYDVIRAYTARSLTFESDRLPALSGFAHLVSTLEMGRYCAGLWESEMPATLLWRPLRALPEAPERHTTRPGEYRAPSWAWPAVKAVIEGYVSYIKDSKVVASVVEVVCEPVASDRFGQVGYGHIVLEAPVLDVVLQPGQGNDQEKHLYNLDRNGERFTFHADVSLGKNGPDYVPFGNALLCVVIERFLNQVNADRATCVVLRPHRGKELESEDWERVGLFNCPHHWAVHARYRQVKIL